MRANSADFLLSVWWMATLAAISRWNSGNCFAFYICSNTLGSLPWAMPFGEGQIQVMRKQAAQVLEWYDGMKNVVPTWYHSRYAHKEKNDASFSMLGL